MKKIFPGLCLFAALALSACSGNKTANGTDTINNSSKDTPTIANDSSHMASKADTSVKGGANKVNSPHNK